jgi:hypothetical protein
MSRRHRTSSKEKKKTRIGQRGDHTRVNDHLVRLSLKPVFRALFRDDFLSFPRRLS